MKIDKVVNENPKNSYNLSEEKTRKVVDFLEQSKEFEDWVTDIRIKYEIPELGYPQETPDEKFAMEGILNDDQLEAFFEEGQRMCEKLNLPYYWWSSLSYFAFYNIFYTPERLPVEVYGPNKDDDYGLKSTKIVIKENITKTELLSLIDSEWNVIKSCLDQLPKPKTHRFERSELAKRIVEMRDVSRFSFKEIADRLSIESKDPELADLMNEDYLKMLYHRYKEHFPR